MTHDLPMIYPFKLVVIFHRSPRGVQVVHQHLGDPTVTPVMGCSP